MDVERPVALEANAPISKAALMLTALGVALLSICVASGAAPFAYALSGMLLPIAVALWLNRPGPFRGELTSDSLRIADTVDEIPLESIEAVMIRGQSPRPSSLSSGPAPLLVVHGKGALLIPADPFLDAGNIYGRLCRHFSQTGSREVHPQLAEFMNDNIQQFGEDLVWTFVARSRLVKQLGRSTSTVVFWAMFLTGWLYLGIGASTEKLVEVTIVGVWLIMIAVIGGLVSFLFRRGGNQVVPFLKRSSLVIAPTGIALAQGDLLGKMSWEEVRDIRVVRGGSFRLTSHDVVHGGLQLVVPAANIVLADVYDRPLWVIEDVICRYWRHPDA